MDMDQTTPCGVTVHWRLNRKKITHEEARGKTLMLEILKPVYGETDRKLGKGTYEAAYLLRGGSVVKTNKKDLLAYRHCVVDLALSCSMCHPNIRTPSHVDIFPCLPIGDDDTTECFVAKVYKECCPALSGAVIRHMGRNVASRRKFAYDVCLALRYMHDVLHIVHGDLKTANIMLEFEESDTAENLLSHGKPFKALVSDFGAAQLGTGRQSFVCTVPYKSPEMLFFEHDITSAPYGCATDVWSLGIIMCDLLGLYARVTAEKDDDLVKIWTRVHGFSRMAMPKRYANGAVKEYQVNLATRNAFQEMLKDSSADEAEVAFIMSCLTPCHNVRPSVNALLSSKYFYDMPTPDPIEPFLLSPDVPRLGGGGGGGRQPLSAQKRQDWKTLHAAVLSVIKPSCNVWYVMLASDLAYRAFVTMDAGKQEFDYMTIRTILGVQTIVHALGCPMKSHWVKEEKSSEGVRRERTKAFALVTALLRGVLLFPPLLRADFTKFYSHVESDALGDIDRMTSVYSTFQEVKSG